MAEETMDLAPRPICRSCKRAFYTDGSLCTSCMRKRREVLGKITAVFAVILIICSGYFYTRLSRGEETKVDWLVMTAAERPTREQAIQALSAHDGSDRTPLRETVLFMLGQPDRTDLPGWRKLTDVTMDFQCKNGWVRVDIDDNRVKTIIPIEPSTPMPPPVIHKESAQ
jgi:hypothetical protein